MREYAESLTYATAQTTSIGGVCNSYCLGGFWVPIEYKVEWIDDPGVFHRADYQAVRAPGSSPTRGVAGGKVWSPDARAAPAASYAMLGFSQPAAPEVAPRAAPAAPEQAPPATGSGRAAAQEAARRIREQS